MDKSDFHRGCFSGVHSDIGGIGSVNYDAGPLTVMRGKKGVIRQ